MVPAVKYQSEDGKQSVILLGMPHVGTKGFYNRVTRYITDYGNKEDKPVGVVKEL